MEAIDPDFLEHRAAQAEQLDLPWDETRTLRWPLPNPFLSFLGPRARGILRAGRPRAVLGEQLNPGAAFASGQNAVQEAGGCREQAV